MSVEEPLILVNRKLSNCQTDILRNSRSGIPWPFLPSCIPLKQMKNTSEIEFSRESFQSPTRPHSSPSQQHRHPHQPSHSARSVDNKPGSPPRTPAPHPNGMLWPWLSPILKDTSHLFHEARNVFSIQTVDKYRLINDEAHLSRQ